MRTQGLLSPHRGRQGEMALLVYCYANGIFGSRRIERATYRDIGVRYVALRYEL